MFKDGDMIVIIKIVTEDELVFFKDVFKNSEGDTKEPQKKKQDFGMLKFIAKTESGNNNNFFKDMFKEVEKKKIFVFGNKQTEIKGGKCFKEVFKDKDMIVNKAKWSQS